MLATAWPPRLSPPRLTQVTYGVGRWGTGELVLRGDRPVHHELPWPARVPSSVRHIDAEDIADRRPADAAERYVKAFARYLSGRRVNFDPEAFGLDETCDEMGMTELERAIAHALARVSGASASPTASSRPAPGDPARRAPRARSARRAARSTSSCRPIASCAPTARSASTARRASPTSSACWPSRAAREPRRQLRIVCLGGGTGPLDAAARHQADGRAGHGDRHADRRRRLQRPPAPRSGDAAARRHPQLPDRAGRGRVAHEPALPAPLRPRRAGRARVRQHLPGRAHGGRRLVRRRRRRGRARARRRGQRRARDHASRRAPGRDGRRPLRRGRDGRGARPPRRAPPLPEPGRRGRQPAGAGGRGARRPDRAGARLALHVDAAAAARAGARTRRAQRARPAHLRLQPAPAAGRDDRLPGLEPRRAPAPARRRARDRQRDDPPARDHDRQDPGRVRPRTGWPSWACA